MDYITEANAALEQRARAFEQRKAVLEDATLTEADKRTRVEAIDADMERLHKVADAAVRAAEKDVEVRAVGERLGKLSAGNPATETRDSEAKLAADFRALATGKLPELVIDLRTATSGTAGNAGNTKQTTFVAQVIEAMRLRSEFFARARTLTTSSGETLEWPVKNGLNPATAKVSAAALTAENVAYAKGDQAWTKVSVGAYKYGVITEATQEIVSDSALNILEILAADMGEAVADVVLTDLMVGNGTSKPWGWVTRATGAINAANLAGVTFDNLIDLQYSLLAPYRRNAVYMFNDTAIGTLRKIKDTTGNYIWQPAVVAGRPDSILGFPVVTDPNVVTSGAGAKVGVFGDPGKYLIRQVKDLRVVRSDEYGFDRDVVAFKATWRGSGDLFDTNSVKALTVTA